MIRIILAVIALLACGYAVYTDLRFRYINDWLTWGLVGVGLAGHTIISLLEWSYTPLLYSIGAATVFFAFGNMLFYLGAYGGGDVKLLTGIAATVPLNPMLSSFSISASWPFLASLMMNILFLGVTYSLFYLAVRAVLKYKKFKVAFLKLFPKTRFYLVASLLGVAGIGIFVLPVVALLAGLACLAIVIVPFSAAVEEIMVYSAKPSELEAGDRPVGVIKVGKRIVYSPRRIGMTEPDVRNLQALEKLGQIDRIQVKDGIPYAPAILKGLFFTLVFGDLLMVLTKYLI